MDQTSNFRLVFITETVKFDPETKLHCCIRLPVQIMQWQEYMFNMKSNDMNKSKATNTWFEKKNKLGTKTYLFLRSSTQVAAIATTS